jgi:hypothetical protein
VGLNIPVSFVEWKPCWRIIPSRFPPIGLFERVADPADLEAIYELESMTNPRLREEVGDLAMVAPEDRISGPGTSAIMAAFTHLTPGGSRFTDGSYGVFYAANNIETAIEETKYHRIRFMLATNEKPQDLDLRVYVVDLTADLHDLRDRQHIHPLVYHPQNYSAGQHLALELKKSGSYGIAYDSVRQTGGECVAIFRPIVLSNCRQERHLTYVWDGTTIKTVYEKRPFGT